MFQPYDDEVYVQPIRRLLFTEQVRAAKVPLPLRHYVVATRHEPHQERITS